MEIQPRHVSLETLFHRRLFRIPQYQRAYSWQGKHRKALFDDISMSYTMDNGQSHFMATIVALRKERRRIVTDNYWVVDVVDGQQRLTTLVLLYKAITKALDRSDEVEAATAAEIDGILLKPDNVCPVLLQTNHDHGSSFLNYLKTGKHTKPSKAKTLAERELLSAMVDCEKFVNRWENSGNSLLDLVGHIKNNLTFIIHEIDDESLVYTVFEVLNSRGLDVSWFDRLKSMLMAVVFQDESGNRQETLDQIQKLWSEIYRIVGLRLGLSTESLRFAATLQAGGCPSSVLSEENAAKRIIEQSNGNSEGVVEATYWIKKVTEVVDSILQQPRMNAVTRIAHARLLAVAVNLRSDYDEEERAEILRRWESVTFRIFGMYNKDAKTKRGDFVRLAWRIVNEKLEFDEVMSGLSRIGKEYKIKEAVENLREEDCYNGWGEELRYMLSKFEEHLADKAGQAFDNEQWTRIWEASSSDSIEHILPQSSDKEHVHWFGNLLLLPPGLNSKLGNRSPRRKHSEYTKTGLLIAQDVAARIKASGRWNKNSIKKREDELLKWAAKRWAD